MCERFFESFRVKSLAPESPQILGSESTGRPKHPQHLVIGLVVRHEVASITVKSAHAELHPLFHQRFPTDTCLVSNDEVRSCRNNVASSFLMAVQPRGTDCDCQPQGGREQGKNRMVKIS